MICIEKGLLQGSMWIDRLLQLSKRFAIITDHQVKDLIALDIQKRLVERGGEVHLFSVPSGERSKTRATKELLEDQMIAKGLGRDTVVIAVGGGVITDLAGFVAATYCRGIPLVSIPTTLLAQVDASIGGKVGVNVPGAKNWIGAFHPTSMLLIDPDVLATLPQVERINGLSEIIKYALIASPSLFKKLQEPLAKFPLSDRAGLLCQTLDVHSGHTRMSRTGCMTDVCRKMMVRDDVGNFASGSQDHDLIDLIDESCQIKQEIVKEDPQEQGLRRILNFGHTIGHAIEAKCAYKIRHGEAIAIGMIAEADLSARLGYLKHEEVAVIKALFKDCGFPLQLPCKLEMETMCLDKKAVSSKPRFVLLERIGKALSFDGAYCTVVDPQVLQETIDGICHDYS